jgi:hypothetical protein
MTILVLFVFFFQKLACILLRRNQYVPDFDLWPFFSFQLVTGSKFPDPDAIYLLLTIPDPRNSSFLDLLTIPTVFPTGLKVLYLAL